MTEVEVFAPAKINLALHVTGKRPDGYHLLDSLVAFATCGDSVIVRSSDRLSLSIEGPFAAGLLAEEDNLVLRAARFLAPDRSAEITLVKRLPVASGIGGGSADAAAALRALGTLWGVPLPAAQESAVLGADVPVCLASSFARMSGIGEEIEALGAPPDLAMVLVNPGVAVSTPTVFRGLARKDNPRLSPMPSAQSGDWMSWLTRQRNDLEAPAIAAAPVIASVLSELRSLPGCALARMSGSGATCFGLFEGTVPADALAALRARHDGWWVAETRLSQKSFGAVGL